MSTRNSPRDREDARVIESLVIGFVRGERSWRELGQIGVSVAAGPGVFNLEADTTLPTVLVEAADVATGLVASHRLGADSTWAQTLLAATFVDLSELHVTRDGRTLLEAIWDVASGGRMTKRALQAANRLASTSA
jgi:hypothetical protein